MTLKADSIRDASSWSSSWGRRWQRLLWPAVLLLALAGVLVLNLGESGGRGAGTPVQVADATLGPLSVDVVATGAVEPSERVEVRHAGAAAAVLETLVREGDRVEAGDLLLRLDTAPLLEAAHREEAAYLQALDRLAEVHGGSREATLERKSLAVEKAGRQLAYDEERDAQIAELHEAGLISRMDRSEAAQRVETSRMALREAELELEAYRLGLGSEEVAALEEEVRYRRVAAERARAALSSAELMAPSAGTVLEVGVRPGETLAPGELAVALADMRRFQVALFVDELETGRLAAGQAVSLQSEYFGGEDVTGVVDRVVPTVLDRRGVPSVEVLVRVSEGRWEPPAGLGVEARIRIDRAEGVVTVPLEAVVERDGRNVVLVALRGRAAQRQVELGLRNESRVEVTRGLGPGEEVIVGGHVFLRDGDPVEVLPRTSSGSLRVEFFQ